MNSSHSTEPEKKSDILVVEDDPAMRRVIRAHLEREGYGVIETHDGSLVPKVLTDGVRVAIVDVHLPVVDGIECLRNLRRDHPQIEVIMLSADHEVTVVAQAMQLGAFWYIPKPIKGQDFVSLVRQADSKARLARDKDELLEAVALPKAVAECPEGNE